MTETIMNFDFVFLGARLPPRPCLHAETQSETPPNFKNQQPRFCEILSPKNCFRKTSSALVPPPAQKLLGQNTKEKCPFHFQEKFHPRQIKKARDIFLWCCREKRGSGGTIRAYDSVSSHHARGACDQSASGLSAKYIRTLFNTHRQNSEFKFPPKIWSARSAVCSAFPPKNSESERIFHAPRGSSFANTIL